MERFKGKLLFMGWFNLPWTLMTDNGKIDLWPIVEQFFISINSNRAEHSQTLDCYILFVDENSEFHFKYIPRKSVVLQKPKGIGMSNIHAYLENNLIWLSGRKIEIDIEEGKQIAFSADKDETVYGVYFSGNGNSCKIPNDVEQKICKIGQPDCCIFLSAGATGFSCEKFNSPIARMLLERLAKGNIRASRIGNCAILGRKE